MPSHRCKRLQRKWQECREKLWLSAKTFLWSMTCLMLVIVILLKFVVCLRGFLFFVCRLGRAAGGPGYVRAKLYPCNVEIICSPRLRYSSCLACQSEVNILFPLCLPSRSLPAAQPGTTASLQQQQCLNISAFCREAIAEKLERLEAVK